MNPANAPSIECDMLHPALTVSDVNAAVTFYTSKLGFKPGFTWGDPPTIAGVDIGTVSIHLCQGTPSPAGCAVHLVVGDVDELHELHRRNGVTISGPLTDRSWGLREYEVLDLHGYRLRFGQHIPETEPKLVIERVDVPVRLERRLAAVLTDLAAHNRMTIGECLEETLLHTFESVDGGGIAGPHTQKTIDYIQTLKAKHGLDYDCHASYRFLEAAAPDKPS